MKISGARLFQGLTLLQLYCLIVYPTWYTPNESFAAKILVFHLFFLCIVANTFIIPRLMRLTEIATMPLPRPPGLFWLLVAGYVAGLVPFLDMPVESFLDSHFHTAFPAAAVRHLDRVLSAASHGLIGIKAGSWIALALCTAALPLWRRAAAIMSPTRILVLAYPIFLGVAIVVSNSLLLHSFGEPKWLHRYPPVGKTLFGAVYALFGITNWGGRLTQMGFTIATAYLILIAAERLPYRNARTAGLAAAALFLFDPFFANVLYYNHIEIGTVFFSLWPLYLLARWRETNDDAHLILYWIAFIAGLYCKQALLFLFPVVGLFLFFDAGSLRDRVIVSFKGLIVPILGAGPYYVFDKFFGFAPSETTWGRLVNPVVPFVPLLQIPPFCGFLLFLLTIAGLLLVLKHLRNRHVRIQLLFVVASLVLLAATAAWMTLRNLIPIYPMLALFAALALDRIESWRPAAARILLLLTMGEMIYCNLFSPRVELINFATRQHYDEPYEELAMYLKESGLAKEKIYAPAICEPSHFYFIMHDVPADQYERKFWADLPKDRTLESFKAWMDSGAFTVLVLHSPEVPRRTRYHEMYWDTFRNWDPPARRDYPSANSGWPDVMDDRVHRDLYENYTAHGFELIRDITRGENTLRILRRTTSSPAP